MTEPAHIPYAPRRLEAGESAARGQALFEEMNARRSVRYFASDPVPRALIEQAIRTASTAPSGANMQPWTFVAVSDPSIKHAIRLAAEGEERAFYETRIPDEWRDALAPIGTDWHKPFLETAPWLVVVFAQSFGVKPDGSRRKHYYVAESVGIACGLFGAVDLSRAKTMRTKRTIQFGGCRRLATPVGSENVNQSD